ncbi:hypothetical protein [Streptomyces sp. NPDC051636]|uniref:hypothetical protein n=1 Tax=Streptomyces sp. NPDC051636 TaxID=3365663 RepID=UPI00379C1CB9
MATPTSSHRRRPDRGPEPLSAERRRHFQIEVARAHAQRRQVADAALTQLTAREPSPELVRTLPMVNQLAADLLTMAQPPSEELRPLAAELVSAHPVASSGAGVVLLRDYE